MTLFIDKPFTSHAGKRLSWKIECDALTDDDWKCLAFITQQMFNFGYVHSIPTGGDKFARHLRKYANKKSTHTLIVDDVMTTGNSMMQAATKMTGSYTGVVVFNRSECSLPWVYSLFTFNRKVSDDQQSNR